MLRVFLLFSILLLAGCMMSGDLGYASRPDGPVSGLFNHHRIERQHNVRLENDAVLYLVQSHFITVDSEYEIEPNTLAREAYKSFVEYFPRMRRAPQPLGLDEAFAAARHEQADYLLYLRLAMAEDLRVMDRAVIQLMLYDSLREKLVDTAHIPVRAGLLTSRNTLPEDFLRRPMLDYARRLQGLGGHPR